jgi:hypothetical protein
MKRMKEDFAQTYSRMSDEELLLIKQDRGSLLPEAAFALDREIAKRKLSEVYFQDSEGSNARVPQNANLAIGTPWQAKAIIWSLSSLIGLGILLVVFHFGVFFLIALLPYGPFFQGPAATVVIFILWRGRAQSRSSGKVADQSSSFARWREGFLFSGLVLVTVAAALDWISIVADYLERYPAATDPDIIDATETVTKAVSFLCGIAAIMSIVGRGRVRVGTFVTAALLLIASLEMMLLESCRHISM